MITLDVDAPWAALLEIRSPGRPIEKLSRTESRQGIFRVPLESGREYAIRGLSEDHRWVSRVYRTGPLVGSLRFRVPLTPQRLVERTIGAASSRVSTIESFDFRFPHQLRFCPWGIGPISRVRPNGMDSPAILLQERRITLVRLTTDCGPYFRSLCPYPADHHRALLLPELTAIKVLDDEKRPVPCAYIQVDPGKAARVLDRRFANPLLGKRGYTDDKGRCAFAKEDLQGATLRVWAWGFAPRTIEEYSQGGPITMVRAPFTRVPVECPETRAGVSHIRQVGGYEYGFTRFVGGELLVPGSCEKVRLSTTSGMIGEWARAENQKSLTLEPASGDLRVNGRVKGASFSCFLTQSPYRTEPFDWLFEISLDGVAPGKGARQGVLLSTGCVMRAPGRVIMAFQGLDAISLAKPRTVRFESEPSQKAELIIVDDQGKPAANALVQYTLLDDPALRQDKIEGERPYPLNWGELATGPSGRVRLDHPKGSKCRFKIQSPRLAPLFGVIEAGESLTCRLTEPAWLKIAAEVDRVLCRSAGAGREPGEPGAFRDEVPGGEPREPYFVGPLCAGKIRVSCYKVIDGRRKRIVTHESDLSAGKVYAVDFKGVTAIDPGR